MWTYRGFYAALFMLFSTGYVSSDDWTEYFRVNPKQKELDADCRKRFPNATMIVGGETRCLTSCAGYELVISVLTIYSPSIPINTLEKKQDGTVCGDGQECLSGVCHSKRDVDKCKQQKMGRPLHEIEVEVCELLCIGDKKSVIDMRVVRPAGASCTFILPGTMMMTGTLPIPVPGICDAKGECRMQLTTKP